MLNISCGPFPQKQFKNANANSYTIIVDEEKPISKRHIYRKAGNIILGI